jgi:HSP20 family molecular chaperone IbpA
MELRKPGSKSKPAPHLICARVTYCRGIENNSIGGTYQMLYSKTQFQNPSYFQHQHEAQQLKSRRAWSRPVLGYNPYATAPLSATTPWGAQHVGYCTPEADVLELDEQFVLEIALPGVVLDDIECKAEENCITVIAKRTPAMFEERAAIIRKELPAGYLVRQFEFECPIIHEQVEARMERGILFVSVPKLDIAIRVPVSAGTIEHQLNNVVRTRVESNTVAGKESSRSSKEVTIK